MTYGTLDNSQTPFAPDFHSDTAAATAYQDDLDYYLANAAKTDASGEAANTQTYGVFVPTDPRGQDFIFIAPDQENLQSVPEPATLVCGALLLLPLAASALRILRKRRKAA
jgi:hypothetical protein